LADEYIYKLKTRGAIKISKKIALLEFVAEFYKDKTRKGISKIAYHHALDVLKNCFIADINGPARCVTLVSAYFNLDYRTLFSQIKLEYEKF